MPKIHIIKASNLQDGGIAKEVPSLQSHSGGAEQIRAVRRQGELHFGPLPAWNGSESEESLARHSEPPCSDPSLAMPLLQDGKVGIGG